MAQGLLWHGLAEGTRNRYSSIVAQFTRFCSGLSVSDPFPASTPDLCLWVAHLSMRPVFHTTIKNYLSALASHHTDMGLASPIAGNRQLERVVRSVKRFQGLNSPVPPKFPLTVDVVRRISQWVPDSLDGSMLRAAMWVGVAGLFRTGEFAIESAVRPDPHRLLTLSSVTFSASAPKLVTVRLKQSKTDPFRAGVDVRVFLREAVEALSAYLKRRGNAGSEDPLFAWSNGHPLERSEIVDAVTRLLVRAGVDTSGHKGVSFRKGGASSLANAGVEDRIVKAMGRWRSWSYARYIHMSDTALATIFAKL